MLYCKFKKRTGAERTHEGPSTDPWSNQVTSSFEADDTLNNTYRLSSHFKVCCQPFNCSNTYAKWSLLPMYHQILLYNVKGCSLVKQQYCIKHLTHRTTKKLGFTFAMFREHNLNFVQRSVACIWVGKWTTQIALRLSLQFKSQVLWWSFLPTPHNSLSYPFPLFTQFACLPNVQATLIRRAIRYYWKLVDCNTSLERYVLRYFFLLEILSCK